MKILRGTPLSHGFADVGIFVYGGIKKARPKESERGEDAMFVNVRGNY